MYKKKSLALLALLLCSAYSFAQFSSGGSNATDKLLRITGSADAPASGPGALELGFNSGSYIQSLDRSNGTYNNLTLFGKDIYLWPQQGGVTTINGMAFLNGTDPSAHREAMRFINYTPNYGSKLSWYQDLSHEIGNMVIGRNGYEGRFWLNLSDLSGNPQPRMYVNGANGNVGFGTEAPQTRVHIVKPEDASYNETSFAFMITQSGSWLGLGGSNSGSYIQSFNGKTLMLNREGNHVSIVGNGGGNVGIGTEAPQTRLHIVHTGAANTMTPGTFALTVQQAGTWTSFGGDNDYSYIQTYGGKPLMINKEGNNVLLNPISGNVGIGTSNPQAKLAVNGTILTKKVKVSEAPANWPDYVFAPSYDLLPLKDLQHFIAQNKHLPEVPSASEVQQQGIDLADNQAVLLKKIEELTLYLIEQNNRIETLQKTVQAQAEQLKKLK